MGSAAEVLLLPMSSRFDTAIRELEARSQEESWHRASVGADGAFRLSIPHVGTFRVRVVAPGFVPMEVAPLAVVEDLRLAPVTLVRDAGTTVRCLDEAGRPLSGARVAAETATPGVWASAGLAGWRPAHRRGRTGEHGEIRLPRAATERLEVAASAGSRLAPPRTGLASGPHLIQLHDGSQQLIEARDPEGRPLRGLLALLGREERPVGFTDADGRLRIVLEAS
ncbi:MAG: carboxypeptidase-like regulatory domain-containing protein, partial [Holophagales bacterium]|nr:carboxypeptidase-like regulatory domain-containing protein [Holophagales bacterium]